MSRCRISEEDAADPHFDGFDAEDDSAINRTEAARESFEDIMASIDLLVFRLYSDEHFKPDADDFDAAWRLYDELKQHERIKDNG